MLRCLRAAVQLESPSGSKPHIDRVARFFANEFRKVGGKVELLEHPTAGAAVLAEFQPRKKAARGTGAKPILLLGHHDTVWDVGTLARIPFRIARGLAYGPGSLDMKSGIVCALWAMRALRAAGMSPPGPVRLFLNPDEEVASVAFRDRILSEARRARAVLVLEPAAAGGALKTARKGVGEFQLVVHGRSAHAGIDPGAGVNAVTELMHQLARVETFARPARGLTINVGVIEGGTRSNVVPERAAARIDVRIPRASDQRAIERRFHALRPRHPGARLEIRGGINRPPLEHRCAVALFRQAREVGRELGLELKEAATGGGSDGNFTAALGVPTLDGLGGVGDGAHAIHEHVLIRELPRRAALLAGLLIRL
jgi:glutamate carboxypeptidase